MQLKLGLFTAVIICIIGCQETNKRLPGGKDRNTAVLLQKANDPTLPAASRLEWAYKADSIADMKNDSLARLKSLECIADLYQQLGNWGSAKVYFLKSATLATGLKDVNSKGIDLSNVGLAYHEQELYDSALKYYLEAVTAFHVLKDTLRTAQGLANVSIEYKNQGCFDQAYKSGIEACSLLEPVNTDAGKIELGSVYTTLGNVQKDVNRLDDALAYHAKAMKLQSEIGDSIGMASSLNNIGNIYRHKKQHPVAIWYYLQAFRLKQQLGRTKSAAVTLGNIAETYLEAGEYKQAELYFQKALDLRKDLASDYFITTENRLGKLYFLEGRYVAAESAAIEALHANSGTGLLRRRTDTYLLLSEITGKLGRTRAALEYCREVLRLKDSLFNSEVAEAVSRMNAQFKTKELAMDLRSAQEQRELQSQRMRQQRIFILLLGSIVILLGAISAILFYISRWRKRAKERIEVLMAELDHRVRNNLQLIGDILAAQISVIKEPGQAAVLLETRNRVQSIQSIHILLGKKGFSGIINTREFLQPLIENLSETYGGKSMRLFTQIAPVQLVVKSAVSLGLIVNELLTNLYKHAVCNEVASITISLQEDASNCIFQISDTCGNWDMVRMREVHKGFGLLLIDTLVRQLHGTWDFISNPTGSVQTITFKKKD